MMCHNQGALVLKTRGSPSTSLVELVSDPSSFVATLFTNVLCEVVANAVKTAGEAITALAVDECFFYSDG
jgi:hypothetical protein